MFPVGDKPRTYSYRVTPDPNCLTNFMEESGSSEMLVEAVKNLYQVPKKPENPIEWLRNYFKTLAPDSTNLAQEREEMIKAELAETEAVLKKILAEDARVSAILAKLELQVKFKDEKTGSSKNDLRMKGKETRDTCNDEDELMALLRLAEGFTSQDGIREYQGEGGTGELNLQELITLPPLPFRNLNQSKSKKEEVQDETDESEDYTESYFRDTTTALTEEEDESTDISVDEYISEEVDGEGIEYDAESEGGTSVEYNNKGVTFSGAEIEQIMPN